MRISDWSSDVCSSDLQGDVDAAEGYPAVLKAFNAWIHRHQVVGWGSWGRYDLHQFKYDCGFQQVPWPFACEHTNFKKVFTNRHPIKKRVGLGTALTMAGLGFDGTPHRGIDDARDIVRLLPFLLRSEEPTSELQALMT